MNQKRMTHWPLALSLDKPHQTNKTTWVQNGREYSHQFISVNMLTIYIYAYVCAHDNQVAPSWMVNGT